MSETALVVEAMRQMTDRLEVTMRECTAVVCAVVIAATLPSEATPERVEEVCAVMRKELAKMRNEGRVM